MDSGLKNIYINLSLTMLLILNSIGLAFAQDSQDLEKAELRKKYQNEFIELYDQELYLQSLRPAKEIVDPHQRNLWRKQLPTYNSTK